MSDDKDRLSEYEKEYVRAAKDGAERNERKPLQQLKDSFKNAYDSFITGTAHLWFDHNGSSYSNLFSKTKSIDEIFYSEIKWNGSAAGYEVRNILNNAYRYYTNEVQSGRGEAFHIFHVSTKIASKVNAHGRISAKDVFNIMAGSVKDFVAPAKSDETASFDPRGPSVQLIPAINLFGVTGDNPISTTAYLNQMLIVNETKTGHLLHPGKIFRFITETPDGIYSNTIGMGNAQYFSQGANIALKLGGFQASKGLTRKLDWINNNFIDNVMGARIFKSQDVSLKHEVGRQLEEGKFANKNQVKF